ncbi:MAG: DHHA1 domain-containing protein [Sulfolobales archaeon]
MVTRSMARSEKFSRDLCVVSHEEDIDGIGSAAVAIKSMKVRCVYLTGYFKDEWLLLSRKIAGRCRDKRSIELLITDLNPNVEMIETLDRSLAKCEDKRVIWIDHHVWSEEALSKARALGYIETHINRSMTATENVIHYFGLEKMIDISVIAYLSRDTDYGLFSHPLSEPLTDVIRYSLYRKGDKRFLIKLARKFSKGIIWDHEIDGVWAEAKREKEKILEDLRRGVVVRDIKGYKTLFLISDPMISSKIAIREAGVKGYDIAFVIYRNGAVTIARGSENINCAEIAMRLGGGGHPHIAGAQIDRKVVEAGLEEIIKYISERL